MAADRLVFPPAKAAQLPFPPGCKVSFSSSAAAASRPTSAVVQSAFIDLSSTGRTTNYEVVLDVLTTDTTVVVSEAQLRYAIDCPVRILGGGDESLPGVIISRPYGGDPPMYSVQIVGDEQRREQGEVIHSLTMECLRYRPPHHPPAEEMLDETAPMSKEEELGGEGDEMKVEGDDEQQEEEQDNEHAPTFAVPSEVIISTASSEAKIATDNNSVGGSMMFSGDDYSVHRDDGRDALMNDQGGPEGDTMRIPRKAREEDKENGHPNSAAALVRNDTASDDGHSNRAKKMKVESHRVELLRVPSFIAIDELRVHSRKLKQLGDETFTTVDIEVAEEGEIIASGGRHHDDGAVYIAVHAKDSQSDVHRCCWGVEDLLYESLPDCLRRPLLFDIMVCGEYGIVDASRVPWEGRTPFTNDPLVVYVERGPAFIRPKSWLGIVSIPSKDIGQGWRALVYDMLVGHRGRKHQELLRQFPGSRISVEIRDDCRDFPHVSIESYGRETLIGAMHHVRGELTKIMKK